MWRSADDKEPCRRTPRQGIQTHEIESVPVQVTDPARTVADCFRYWNEIGIDVAIEALRDYRRLRKGSLDALARTAQAQRVARVMRPCLEALA